MKIVHLCLCGPVTDGWNYQDNMLTKYHKKAGNDVTIITSKWVWSSKGKLEKFNKSNYFNEDGVKMIRLELKGKDDFTKKFKKYRGIYESIEDENPNILFIHNVSFIDINEVVKYLKKNKSVKVYVDNHSDFSNSATSWISKNILHKIIWRHMAQKIEPYTKQFYGVLPARVDFLVDLYKIPKEKASLLVMGADDERVKAAEENNSRDFIRKKYGISDKDFLIVTGGKIDEAKTETIYLMEAIKKLNRKDIKIIIFGSVIDSLKGKVNELNDGHIIQYIGWIDSKESYSYFKAADLAVFPGRHSVFWEQVAGQGIPMLCKRWEGTTHVDMGGNVLFLNESNIDEIVDMINKIVTNKGLYTRMKSIASDKSKHFLYSNISARSIEKVSK